MDVQLNAEVFTDIVSCVGVLLQVMCILVEDLGVERHDRALANVHVELVVSRWQPYFRWTFLALGGCVKDVAPGTFGEDEQCLVDVALRLNGQLETAAEHDVVRLVLVGFLVLREVEEERAEEGTTFLSTNVE